MAKKETEITEQQIDQITDQLSVEWLKIGYSTERLDRPSCEAIITKFYKAIDLAAPIFSYADSPFGCYKQITALSDDKSLAKKAIDNAFGGALWVYWEAALDAGRKLGVVYDKTDNALLDMWLEQSKQLHLWFPYESHCFISERPIEIHVLDDGRLHNVNGAALKYTDDYSLYAVRGLSVPERFIKERATLTIKKVLSEKNAELRRVLIELMGEDKYIEQSGMRPVAHDDKFGTIYLERLPIGRPIARLRVVNSTAEPDGTFRIYWLPFNPDHFNGDAGRIPQAAAASTWRTTQGGSELLFQDWREYNPEFES